MIVYFSASDNQTQEIAARLATVVEKGTVIHLKGDLGAGKTTFARGFLGGFGYQGAVKSPTYNIVHSYNTNQFPIYHFDLYRLSDPEELEAMGIRDYFDSEAICLLEWPEKGRGLLPEPDLCVNLDFEPDGRKITINALSTVGEHALVHYQKISSEV